ncbi:pyrimidine-specific ribonucleoside hydrolase RihA [soil metagenome]
MKRIHVDTDLGGDTDDAFALAMLLGWPDVEITGINTTCERDGIRAAYTRHLLELAGRTDIPVAAGAEAAFTNLGIANPILNDERHWPTSLTGKPSPPGAALDLLSHSLGQGATIGGIGSYANLALLEVMRTGSLARTPVVLMGGWFESSSDGLPQWGPEMDWNVQWDTRAAEIVFASASDLTLVTLSATLKAHLRAADLPRLRASGPLGALLASQGEAHGDEHDMRELGRAHAPLPDDLLNFQCDPVACAIAAGWSGAVLKDMTLGCRMDDKLLRLERDPDGRPVRVLVDFDAEAFHEIWLSAIEAAQR